MKYFLKERDTLEHSRKNAGSKARNDVETILTGLGYAPLDVVLPYRPTEGLVSSVLANVRIERFFRNQLSVLRKSDELFVQFPPRSHSVLFPFLFRSLRKKGVRVTFLIHDLERLRIAHEDNVSFKKRVRILLEESYLLREADKIICHNEQMKRFLEGEGIPSSELVSLGIFDYLTDAEPKPHTISGDVLIAGNLSPEKTVYLTQLQDIPAVSFQLYGVGFEDRGQPNVTYHGAFEPEELVGALDGAFGLVWDGTSIDTCTGVYGNYLRYNDPHKLSLYLTAGLPVIVWEEAAVADFVREHNVGFAVKSLKDIPESIAGLTENDYTKMAANAALLSQNLRKGQFLRNALER